MRFDAKVEGAHSFGIIMNVPAKVNFTKLCTGKTEFLRIATLNTWLDGWFGYGATPKVTEEKIATWNIADNHQFIYSCDCMVQCVKILHQYVKLQLKFIKFHN